MINFFDFVNIDGPVKARYLSTAFSHDFYHQLRAQLPVEFLTNRKGSDFFSRLTSMGEPQQFETFLSTAPAWSDVISYFSKKETVTHFLTLFSEDITRARGLTQNLDSNSIEVNFDFHLAQRGYFLAPHTDTGFKVLSLVFYLPNKDMPFSGGGTRLYKPKSNLQSTEYLHRISGHDNQASGKNRDKLPLLSASLPRIYKASDQSQAVDVATTEFDKHYECYFGNEFNANSCLAFVKASDSWHDVRLQQFPADTDRWTFLVNFNVKPSLLQRVKAKVNSLLS